MLNNFYKYSEPIFTDVWGKVEDFLADYNDAGIKKTISDESATTLFYLLYSRYGNSTIAFTDITQFKYNVLTIVFMYGPTWEERLRLQEKLRNLTDDEILQGGRAIYNSSLNPGTGAAVDEQTGELNFINNQNTTNYKKSKMEAIALKWDLLDTDVTSEFLNKFRPLFRKILDPMNGVYYATYNNETIEGEQI